MIALGSSLNVAGISRAAGADLVAPRDQIAGTAGSRRTEAQQSPAPAELTPDQQRQVARLQQLDRTVRAHEAAHMQAARELVTNGPSYTYTYGPDGRQYAVGGEVGIDTSAASKPQANIDKGRRIQAAALAPADPSAQDYRVATAGAELEARGRTELAVEQRAAAATPATEANRQRLVQVYGAAMPTGATTGLSVFA